MPPYWITFWTWRLMWKLFWFPSFYRPILQNYLYFPTLFSPIFPEKDGLIFGQPWSTLAAMPNVRTRSWRGSPWGSFHDQVRAKNAFHDHTRGQKRISRSHDIFHDHVREMSKFHDHIKAKKAFQLIQVSRIKSMGTLFEMPHLIGELKQPRLDKCLLPYRYRSSITLFRW